MTKLSDLMGTKYITNEHAAQLRKVLSEQTEVDLAGCKFMPLAERCLREFYKTVKFCNSQNRELNTVLQHNMEAVLEQKPTTVPIEAVITGPGDIRNIIASLDESVIYDLSNMSKQSEDITLPGKVRSVAILAIMKKPNIMIDLDTYARTIFTAVRTDWLKTWEPHDAYWELEGASLVKREVKEGLVYKPGVGQLAEKVYVKNFMVLPYEFGTEDVFGSPEFKIVRDTALNILRKPPEKKKTMKDFIEVLE